MLAVAGGLCRHALVYRTVTEATRRRGHRPARHRRRLARDPRLRRVSDSLRRDVGGELAGALRAPAHVRVRHDARAPRHHRHHRAPPRGVQPEGDLPRADDAWTTTSNARMVSDPFGLFDCDAPVDGSTAVIVSTAETAARPAASRRCVSRRSAPRSTRARRGISGATSRPWRRATPRAHMWTRTDLQPSRRRHRAALRRLLVPDAGVDRGARLLRPRRERSVHRERPASIWAARCRSIPGADSSPAAGCTASASSPKRCRQLRGELRRAAGARLRSRGRRRSAAARSPAACCSRADRRRGAGLRRHRRERVAEQQQRPQRSDRGAEDDPAHDRPAPARRWSVVPGSRRPLGGV